MYSASYNTSRNEYMEYYNLFLVMRRKNLHNCTSNMEYNSLRLRLQSANFSRNLLCME